MDGQFRFGLYGDHARKIHERDGETETGPVCWGTPAFAEGPPPLPEE